MVARATAEKVTPIANSSMIGGHECVLISALMNGVVELPVTASDFFSPPNRTIYNRIIGLKNRSLLAVTENLRRNGELEKIGGAGRITEIHGLPHDEANVAYALQEVLEASRTRTAAKIGQQLVAGEISPQQAQENLAALGTGSGNAEFTVRRADEIVELKLDEHDCLIGDRLLSKGGKFVIAGPAGIGKSRFLMQLAASCISGRDICGIETHAKGEPWLLLQTENSNRRLQHDLQTLKREFGKSFLDRLFIHTIESDTDGILALDDESAVRRIEAVIRKVQPGIIGIDPLRDFIPGNPDSDQDMIFAVLRLGAICRVGNPHRAIIVVHHALTGKAGAAKATGWERSGFARNSKALLGWTRSQINIAPASPDDNEALIIACGKNNDGKEFSPFAVRLNPDKMIYEQVADFDIDSWREQLSAKPQRFTVDVLRDLRFKEMEIKPLAKLIVDKIGCGRSRAYELIREGHKAKILKFNKLIDTYAKN